MARSRLPRLKAEASGAAAKNPQRFRDRTAPKRTRAIGPPYAGMAPSQIAVWEDCVENMPWLHSAHRLLLRQACVLAARMSAEDVSVATLAALGVTLMRLGATPVDETKLIHGNDEEEDPAAEFFGRPN